MVAKPPTPQTMGKSALEAVGVPGHVTQVLQDPEQSIALTTSKNMWTSNPGYIVRDGARMASTTHKDFVYDQEEVRPAGLGERWGQHACSMLCNSCSNNPASEQLLQSVCSLQDCSHPVPQLALLSALVQACHSHWTLPL